MKIVQRIKRRILAWLLSDGIPELKVGEGTVSIDGQAISLPSLESDPTLAEGKTWYRSDLDRLQYAISAAAKREVPYGTIGVDAHAARHGSGGADEASLAAAQITSGIFALARIPTMDDAHIPESSRSLKGLLAERPTFGVAGRLYWATDTDEVYRDTETAWDQIMESVSLKDGDYAGALVGISGAATGRAAKLDNLDALISSRSSHTPASVWGVAARTLTGITGAPRTNLVGADQDIAAKLTADHGAGSWAGATAADIWGYATRALTDKAGFSLSSGGVNAIRRSVCLGTDPVDSIGRLLKNYIDAKVSDAKYFDVSSIVTLDDIPSPYNPAVTGTMPTPTNIIDNNTATRSDADTVGQYTELTWDFEFTLFAFRVYVYDTAYVPNARIKVQYHNGTTFVDWQTDIQNEDTEGWSSWYTPGEVFVKGKKLRVVVTALDGQGFCRVLEVEFKGVLLYRLEVT